MGPPYQSLFPRLQTLRFRISVLYMALIGLVLAVLQIALYLNYAYSVSREFDNSLRMKAEQIGGAVNTFKQMLGSQPESLTLASQKALNLNIEYPDYTFMTESAEKFWLADAKKLGLDRDYLAIMDTGGNIIAASPNVPRGLAAFFKRVGASNAGTGMFYDFKPTGGPLRIIVVPYYYDYNQVYLIAVGVPYRRVEAILHHHVEATAFSTVLFLLIASLIVRLFVIRVLSPIMEISNTARNITQENLHARILLPHADKEIEHLTASLNGMIARLEKSFIHIKEFSAEMAHEVKTPLAIISGESQLALSGEETPPQCREAFVTILKEAKRTQKFVSDLLLLTKLDFRLIKLRFEQFDLGELLDETCRQMQLIAASKAVLLENCLGAGPFFIYGDKIHLRRVFLNLLDNALKFTPSGGRVEVTASCRENKVFIGILDTGCGIAPSNVERVFNKYYRVSENGIPDAGCGLGLSIVYSILTHHGGKVSVESSLGEGSVFKVELPLVSTGMLMENSSSFNLGVDNL